MGNAGLAEAERPADEGSIRAGTVSRVVATWIALVLLAGAVAAIAVHPPAATVRVALKPGGEAVTSVPDAFASSDPNVVTTTVSIPITIPAVTLPPVTAPPRTVRPTTVSTRATSTSASVVSRTNPERPPCPGEPYGYGGFGCKVTATEGRITATYSEYSQILQVGRDRAQLILTATDSANGYLRHVRFVHGDGTISERDTPYYCGQSYPAQGDNDNYVFTRTGRFDVSVTVTSATCGSPGMWQDEESITLTIPVLVCTEVATINGDARCTKP